jgi:chorismate dehydratase
MLTIGQIEYANCTPLFHVLREQFPSPEYRYVSGVPAELNRKLLAGEVQVCPSSSIEYACHPEQYRILPQLSISSDGPVASVLLFSPVPIEELNGRKILLSSESATSVNLLKILLAQRFNCACTYEVTQSAAFDREDESSALLLIGDAALRACVQDCSRIVYDLGELWHSWTGCPFVFALWLCRAEIAEEEELKKLARSLIQARDCVPLHLERIAACSKEVGWMGYDRLLAYWRNNISYNLNDRALAGLRLYFDKCFEGGLITAVPLLRFVSP